MFETEQQKIEEKIKAHCAANDIPLAALKWTAIPFSGEWGIATSFFQTAADEARAGKGKKLPVPQRAQEIAEQVKAEIGSVDGISRVDAVKGYLNLYFTTSEYAHRVVDEVLASRADFGRGQAKNERVMVEYAQPNTHHSFHIGHARNTILGEVLARLVEFAGFDTIRATYPGDMGLSVITVVWAYEKFYKGQEPEGIHERGRWLLKIYAEATAKLHDMKATIKGGITRYETALKSETEWSSIGFAVAMNNLKVSASTMAAEIIQLALLITGISGYKNDTPYSIGRHLRDALSAIVMISNDRILSNTSNLLLVSRFDTSLLG